MPLRRRLRSFRRPWRELRARAAAARAALPPAELPALERALEALAGGEVLPDEQRRLDGVEGLAASLAAERGALRIVDHGVERGCEEAGTRAGGGRPIVRELAEHHRRTSIPPAYGLVLFRLVRALRPAAALELGTSLGISAAYQAVALDLNGSGRLVTLEGAPELAERARANLARLGLDRVEVRTGRFEELLEPALHELGAIAFAFVDGHHDESATVAYFQRMRGHLAGDAVLVFDDIGWSPGMRRAWARIRRDDAVRAAFELGRLGVCTARGSFPAADRSDRASLPARS